MKWKTRLVLRESVFTTVAFTAAVYSYYVFAFWGLQDNFVAGPLRDYLASPAVHVEFLSTGVLFGSMLGVINRLTETPRLRHRPMVQVILIRTVLYLFGMAVVAAIVFGAFVTLILPIGAVAELWGAITLRNASSFVIWIVLVVGSINLALEVERVLGPGNLWRLFIGRYRRPREEQRVFLFMDLKGSTTLTETLGNARYSALLQACYQDLTKVVMQFEADVYQYVGDEVVMSWPSTGGAQNLRASVLASFAYQKALLDRREWYELKFGVMPVFRSGIDVGPVTTIEVGDVKRQIVYHGDVLNTAARLLELCKTRGEHLFVSHSVGSVLQNDTDVRTSWRGAVPLRGKQQPVDAYALRPV